MDNETNNWFKACIALNFTKEGLTNFVDIEIKTVHTSIGRSCGNCCTENLITCPTKGICKRYSNNCNYHTQTKQPRQCPMKLCDLAVKSITSQHRYNGPSWLNTKAELWSIDHWQIAKCFFPPDGYTNVASIHETDFNGVISALLNCKHFDSCISFNIAPKPPAPECLLTQARRIGRAVRHTPDCKVTDDELRDFFQTLDTLLADSKCLAKDPAATSARTKLSDNDRLSLTELGELLKEANQTLIQAKEAGERFSEKAERTMTEGLNTLEAAINAGTKRIENQIQTGEQRIKDKTQAGEQRIEDKIQAREQHIEDKTQAREQRIEDKTQAGEQRIENKTHAEEQRIEDKTHAGEQRIEVKTQAGEQRIENKTHAEEQRIESKTQKIIDRINQAANENEQKDYERGVADLLRRLVDNYRDTVSYVPLSTLDPSLDKQVQDVFATPKIHRIKIENDGRRTKQEEILTYKDCFYRGIHLPRRTYLQGEPGSGKTTFASKLVYDWCNVHAPSTGSTKEQTAFGDVDTLLKFKFLFFISLRDSREHTYVTQMIKNQLINKIFPEDEWESAYKLVLQIMKNVMYLVIQDGLDEWPGKESMPSMDGIPKDQCIVITTSRPWKLADERIRNSQIDILLELEGISDSEEFNERILRCLLDETRDIQENVKQFEQFLRSRNLESISASPMLHTLVLCTWVDDMAERLTGSSLCELYTTMLENLCKKANPQMGYFDQYHTSTAKCFSGTKYIKPNMENIDAIAKAAFSFLFSNESETSLVFSDINLSAHLSENVKQFALDSGLLSKRKGKKSYDNTNSFVHKTIQEFLAAHHISSNTDVIDKVISKYLKLHRNSYLDMSQVFIFLCGFNISAANKLSALMNEMYVNSEYALRNEVAKYRYHHSDFQKCILSGYKEAVANKNTPIDLHLSHFDFNSYNAEDLIHIWTLNTSRARSSNVPCTYRHVTIRSQDVSSSLCQAPGPVSLSVRDDYGPYTRADQTKVRTSACYLEFDWSSCHSLERLELCVWSGFDDYITVLPNALLGLKNLKYLEILEGYKCEALDLSSCPNLERLVLGGQFDRGYNITVLPNALLGLNNLKYLEILEGCRCEALDLTHCEHIESIKLKQGVTLLPLSLNNYKTLNCIKLYTTYAGLDLSLFENLNSIRISSKVKVLPKPLLSNNKLTHIGLDDFDFNSFDNKAIHTWCLLNGADPEQCADYTPVLPSIEHIEMLNVKCSSTLLRSLCSTLLTLNHRVKFDLSLYSAITVLQCQNIV